MKAATRRPGAESRDDLFGFNLMPAFPMDGGRVLRALLASRLDYARASEIAARVGQGIAFLFGLAAIFTGYMMLMFIALFGYLGAEREAALARMLSATDGLPVRSAMATDYKTLQSSDPLSHARDLLLSGYRQDFPDLDGSRVAGILTRENLLGALGRGNLSARTGDVAHGDAVSVDDEMLEDVLRRMQASGQTAIPVLTRNGSLAGNLSLENIGELMMSQPAIGNRRSRRTNWGERFHRAGSATWSRS